MDTLATVDVCVNEVTPTIFCDIEGFDLVPFQMVLVIQDPSTHVSLEGDEANTLAKENGAMYIKDEILIQDRGDVKNVDDSSFEMEDQHGELFYDASDELEEYQEKDCIVIQLKNRRQVEVPNSFPP